MGNTVPVFIPNHIKPKDNEFYPTPYIITEALLDRISFNKKIKILEPCCGGRIQVCSYKETDKPLVSYRINSNRAYVEKRSKDNDG